jgi:hypothetical protein
MPSALQPAAEWYFIVFVLSFFALATRKKRAQKKGVAERSPQAIRGAIFSASDS